MGWAISVVKTFLVSYEYDGSLWATTILAEDAQDAKERLEVMRYGTIDGEVIATVPAELGFIVKAAVALQNWYSRD